MNLIKVLDPVRAKELQLAGFNYTKEVLGGDEIFVFIQTPEIMNKIRVLFAKTEYFIDKTMNFSFEGRRF